MKTIRLLLKICKAVFIGVLLAALLFNLIGVFKRVVLKEQLPLVCGYGNAVILTGSMAPVISSGDMVIIRCQKNYAVGDIVTYSSSTPVTHRIIGTTAKGYITQGDANNTSDGEIEAERIIGKVVGVIHKFGNVIIWLQSPFGMFVLILILVLLIIIPRLFKKRSKSTL